MASAVALINADKAMKPYRKGDPSPGLNSSRQMTSWGIRRDEAEEALSTALVSMRLSFDRPDLSLQTALELAKETIASFRGIASPHDRRG